MKVYVGIDMAKDKFDYCAMDDSLNILCRGGNKENRNKRFKELSDLIRTLESTGTMMKIGMESTGIYHIPLYNHLRKAGFPVRILNGLEVRGMKKSRVRKTTNDTDPSQHRTGASFRAVPSPPLCVWMPGDR